ncbi:MAG: 4-hydroxy-tetrahydrodipicolinate reductase [Peptococcaceae bacterium]|nr:4-hydroxy-tetrahydrodipicolinate reductase [Peptococcaceae bacterium]
MIHVILSGCNGRMGQAVTALLHSHDDMKIVAGMDLAEDKQNDYSVYSHFDQIRESADIVIDFSHVSLTLDLLAYCVNKHLPLVLCTTGITEEQEAQVAEAAKEIPIFRSLNMSLGISLLQALVRQAARVLGDSFDIEIVEKHHQYKVDAPSGTAFMIAEAAASGLAFEPRYIYDRSCEHRQRDHKEIGIHSVRGGTIIGEHEAMFIGPNEILTISHSVQSRELFANGAVKAAAFLLENPQPQIYNMDDLVRSLS